MPDERLFAIEPEVLLSPEPSHSSREYRAKSPDLQQLINEALMVLYALGVPPYETPRRIERMAMAFLAAADLRPGVAWSEARSVADGRAISTREIIEYWNAHFEERVSPGGYDDVRRKDLLYLVEAGVVVPSQPDAARNDPSRGYALEPEYIHAVRAFGTDAFDAEVERALSGQTTLAEKHKALRELQRIPIQIAAGKSLSFGPGEHNALIRAVIEQFLPRYGHGAEVLYVGDAENKDLHIDKQRLQELGFFDLAHGELPDVVAYSESKGWLYVVEAVHSFGPISAVRRDRLTALLDKCTAGVVFVTAFATRVTFRKWVKDIAWETEVWIAEEPDHLVHFDGVRFLGPFPSAG